MAAMLETMCAAFGDPRIDWSACSAKEDQDGVSNYAQVAALYPAAAQCAVSDGATGFRWFRPCEWQAIANLPATCERAYEPQQPPAPPADASIGVVDKDAMAADLGLPVPGGATEPCQANAFCSACVAADGSTARFLRGDQKSVRDAALRRRKDHPIGFVARPKKADDGSTDLMIWDVARAARTGPSRRPRSTRPVAGLERHVDEAGLERRRHFDEALRNTAVALV